MHQILFDFGVIQLGGSRLALRIYGYGLMLVLGFIFGILLAQWRARRAGEDPREISRCAVLALVGGVLGARLAYVLVNFSEFRTPDGNILWSAMFDVAGGGLVYFGGLFGGAALVVAYLRWRKLPFRRFLDIIAVSLMVGLAFGRAGCLLNGCCWGGPADEDSIFATRFPMVSRPLVRLGGECPYAPDQQLCPTYAHSFNAGRVTPDERLVNRYDVRAIEGPDGKPMPFAPALSPTQLHGQLTNDQLAGMRINRARAKEGFDAIAGADGLIDPAEFAAAKTNGKGLLRGSEIYEEAAIFSNRGNGLDFAALWAYLQQRYRYLVNRFDADGNGKLNDTEAQAANAYLQADLWELLAQQGSDARRPAQLLGIINGLILAGLLAWFYRQRRREGEVFVLMIILYPITRLVLESIRSDDAWGLLRGDWTHNQITSVILFAAGVGCWFMLKRFPVSAGPTLTQRLESQKTD